MICKTNKKLRKVDDRLHRLSVQRLGKTASLPSLELTTKKQSMANGLQSKTGKETVIEKKKTWSNSG